MIFDLDLFKANPPDCLHVLAWDRPNDTELRQLAFLSSAERVKYREELLARTKPGVNYLMLDKRLDEEIQALRNIDARAEKPVVILEQFECLLTYLASRSANTEEQQVPISLFWQKLRDMRHFEKRVWILLPTRLVPVDWPERRLIRFVPSLPEVS